MAGLCQCVVPSFRLWRAYAALETRPQGCHFEVALDHIFVECTTLAHAVAEHRARR